MVHIGIGFDPKFLRPFYAWATSLELNHGESELHIHVLCNGLSEKDFSGVQKKLSHFASVTFYSLEKEMISGLLVNKNWTSAVYYRLYLPLLVPDTVTRIIYCDLDTLILDDPLELYCLDLEGHPVGAVYDNYVRNQPAVGIYQEGNYFNSGMLLIDLAGWKSQDISGKAIRYLMEHPQNILFVDQCALNAVLVNNWHKLPEKYNLLYSYVPEGMSRNLMRNFIIDKVIIHFTLQRPWKMLCRNRYRNLYFKYLKASGLKISGKYEDFDIKKIPSFLRIRLIEFYQDYIIFQKIWRYLKNLLFRKTNIKSHFYF